MNRDGHQQIVRQIAEAADEAVRVIVTSPHDVAAATPALERMVALQERCGREFPVPDDEVALWEALWRDTDEVREQWRRVEKAAVRAGGWRLEKLREVLDGQRRDLYEWTRRFIAEHAPRVPTPAHFELGIGTVRTDRRGLHERIEGLYESLKRIGRLPQIHEGVEPASGRVNFAVIYGGGWNVSTFSVLREASRFGRMNAFVAFDHAGPDLYGTVQGRSVRLATSGLLRLGDGDDYALATFRRPVVLHFVCPHEWTGPPAHQLGIPVLRSELTLEIVDDKRATTSALQWYNRSTGAHIPLPREAAVEAASVPGDAATLAASAGDAVGRLEAAGVREVVVKPCTGEQGRGIGFFELPQERPGAVQQTARLALESGAVIQERIRPLGGGDFDWRVLVALSPEGEPEVVGRFARRGRGEEMEMMRDRDALAQSGITGLGAVAEPAPSARGRARASRARRPKQAIQRPESPMQADTAFRRSQPAEARMGFCNSALEADALLARLNAVSLDAFRAVCEHARTQHPDYPWRPLGGGSYHQPYLLGVDLIGDARVIEVNGNEVAGMWTDDRLYPETRGRSSRTVLQSAELAGRLYRGALQARP